jgi:hypothetical protein
MFNELGRLHEVASGQWSLVTRAQLIDVGLSEGQIITLLRSGVLRTVRRAVYALVGSPRSWQQTAHAAVLAAGEGALASHATAARLWVYTYLPADSVDVLVVRDAQPGMKGVHRTTILPEMDVTERSGIPCTSFERTLCDCTTILSPFQLGRVLDDGLRRNLVSLDRLTACVFRLDSGPHRRLRVVQQLLAERDASFDPGGSASELRVLAVLRDAGVPAPVQQFRIRVDSHWYVLDFAWPEQHVFAEYYGLAVHSGASAVEYDNSRLTAMVGEDWRPLVFTDATPDHEIIKRTKQALALASRDRRFDAA